MIHTEVRVRYGFQIKMVRMLRRTMESILKQCRDVFLLVIPREVKFSMFDKNNHFSWSVVICPTLCESLVNCQETPKKRPTDCGTCTT